jgi:hypothetical protein
MDVEDFTPVMEDAEELEPELLLPPLLVLLIQLKLLPLITTEEVLAPLPLLPLPLPVTQDPSGD